MPVLKRHIDIDLKPFQAAGEPLPTRYGLPAKVHFCTRCGISNQRPNSTVEYKHTRESLKKTIRFDDDGICDACRAAEHKASVDWSERDRELRELCDLHRRDDGRYDCIVPGSGGKDSFYAAHVLRDRYGMHPLTVTWAPHLYTDWGWRNMQAWIHAGFDNVLVTPNGRVHRLLTRLGLETLFHPFQPFIFGQKSIGPREAALRDVPLVFYGENEAEYGNPVKDMESARRDWAYFAATADEDVYLGGVSMAELKTDFGLRHNDLELYRPVDPDLMERQRVEVHYLGYYLKWHPQSAYYYSVEHGGFEASPERTPGTYSKYNSLDDKIDDLHYFTTYIKFGIGRATYDASQEVRSGDLDRDEALALIRRFDGEYPHRFEDEVFRYLSIDPKAFGAVAGMFESPTMDRDYFLDLADRFRSPHLWKFENGAWALRHTVWQDNGK